LEKVELLSQNKRFLGWEMEFAWEGKLFLGKKDGLLFSFSRLGIRYST
jgi:hypothetical protein